MSGSVTERKLAAILAADVVGYSRQLASDEAGTLARLSALQERVLIPLLAEHGGRLFKIMGDGFLAEFTSAVQAVSCALAVQARLTDSNDTGLQLRIGIHQGDVVVQDDDLFGDGVNIASRLEAIAEPGGIVLSARVREDLTGKLTVTAEDMGEQSLKNIATPLRAFRIRPTAAMAAPMPATAAPQKPSIAVLPFANMSGDTEQEYFVDGITNDIIAELSRFRALLVIAASSTFTYKGKATDVRQVARELGVRYVLAGNARKAGNRVRVAAHLTDAATGSNLWAEHYDRTLDDIFAVQEDVTRGIVAAVAPTVEIAEMAQARHASPNDTAARLIWRAKGLATDLGSVGDEVHFIAAIEAAEQAVAADPTALEAYATLGWSHVWANLWRVGPSPGQALEVAWSVAERMMRIDALDHRTLTLCGVVRVRRGEIDRGLADLRRALDINPNSALTMMTLAYAEATAGMGSEAEVHALLSIRLNPRDSRMGTAYLALAMARFSARDYPQAVHWAELAIQSQPSAPIRRALMIACAARAGDLEHAARERATLNGFAPHFIASLFRGENRVFSRTEDMEHLLEGLRLAGCEE